MPALKRLRRLPSPSVGGGSTALRHPTAARFRFLRSVYSSSTTTTKTTTTSTPPVATASPRHTNWPTTFFSSHIPTPSSRPPPQVSRPAPQPSDAQPQQSSPAETTNDDPLPPFRRRRSRRNTLASEFALASGTPSPPDTVDAATLPPDASALLGASALKSPAKSLKRALKALLSLSKPRLTVLVVLSAMAPYALYPSPDLLSPALTETPSLSPLTLLFLTTGTALCSASANALNMLYEPKTDGMMSRTRNRPLVRALLGRGAAVAFAVACGVVGAAGLWAGVNPTVAWLGVGNIALYAGVYTPMKRLSAANTWVGALVGGIPPLMGWAAAAGESAVGDGSWMELLFNFSFLPGGTGEGVESTGGWLLAGLLFAWQFPHFMALSWPIREEYRRAGLRMLCWVNPARNARVALRYSLLFPVICVGLCAAGVTEWSFAVTSLPVNGWLAVQAWRFWKKGGHGATSRGLFWASVWHLPVVMVLALLQKKDMWGRVWASVTGRFHHRDGLIADEEDEHEWVYVDEGEEKTHPKTQTPTQTPARRER